MIRLPVYALPRTRGDCIEGTLHTGSRIDGDTLRLGTLLAVAANACTRAATAVVAGGAAFGSRVALSLLFSTACAGAVAWAVR